MGTLWNPVTLERGLRAEFNVASQVKPDPILDALMLKVPSTKDEEKYGWLGHVDDMKEWKDEKQSDSVTEHSYTVPNVQYEGTLSVKATNIKDDQVGGIMQRMKDLTTKGRFHPQRLLIDKMIAGAAAGGEAYDGQYFFDTDHAEGSSGTQGNTGSGAGVTVADITTDFNARRAKILGRKDSKGKPLFETNANVKWVVVAPLGLLGVFEQLQNAAIISNTTNTIKGLFDLVTLARLTSNDANDWYLYAYTDTMKPFILQERDPLTFHSQEEGSDTGFWKNIFAYSVHWRGAVGYGWWQLAERITNT